MIKENLKIVIENQMEDETYKYIYDNVPLDVVRAIKNILDSLYTGTGHNMDFKFEGSKNE